MKIVGVLVYLLMMLVRSEENYSCQKCKSIDGGPFAGQYHLKEENSQECDEVKNAINRCLYAKEDGSKYCFRPGKYTIEKCSEFPQKFPRIRRKLTPLTDLTELRLALKEAKVDGTYKPSWPEHTPNLNILNSTYNAAAGFHGYPYLCGGPPRGKCCIHGSPLFLPWHRLLMIQLEDALREKHPDLTLPYWDWTVHLTQLPDLVTADPQTNAFYNSTIPGLNDSTERNDTAIIDYTNGCMNNPANCSSFPDISVLGNLVLLALERPDFESFTSQIEHVHGIVHHLLGQDIPSNYTMLDINFSSYDPIFLVFHTMVDFQWAIWQALEKIRPPQNKPPFQDSSLEPFCNPSLNSNKATKDNCNSKKTINYQTSLEYAYDNLTLFGMDIHQLNESLISRNYIDRLFAGFSLPRVHISDISFNLCYPIKNCTYSSPYFKINKLHRNEKANSIPNDILFYFEVTNYLSGFGLDASQDIGFKIVSSSLPANITHTPVSIYRKANSTKDRITIFWSTDKGTYNYAPYFKSYQNSNTAIRFVNENGQIEAHKYPDQESFDSCSDNKESITQEIGIEEEALFFQNPLNPPTLKCEEQQKLVVVMSNPGKAKGNQTIKWKIPGPQYAPLCMLPGSYLTFEWEGKHDVLRVSKDGCNFTGNFPGIHGPHNLTYPQDNQGFKDNTVYYIVCPVGNHCNDGMQQTIRTGNKCPQ